MSHGFNTIWIGYDELAYPLMESMATGTYREENVANNR